MIFFLNASSIFLKKKTFHSHFLCHVNILPIENKKFYLLYYIWVASLLRELPPHEVNIRSGVPERNSSTLAILDTCLKSLDLKERQKAP